jgi:tetratricopeptide (TPR) repeat protein
MKPKISDPFISLLRSHAIYQHMPFSIESPLELKKVIREAAEDCRKILQVKEEEENLLAANIVACLLAERGRLDDGIEVLHSFQDLIKEHKGLINNLALMKYSSGNFVKSFSCYDVDKNSLKSRYKSLFLFALMEIGDLVQAEKLWKYRMLVNPSLKAFYNLTMMLHLKIKNFFKSKIEKYKGVETLIANTQHAEKIFRKVFESIPSKVFVCLEQF